MDIISATLRISTPLIFAALGGLLCLRAGVFNIALEGFMLIGAFAGVAGTIISGGSSWAGILFAMLMGTAFSLIFALASLKYKANQIVVSIAINMFGLGLTSFLLKSVFQTTGALRPEIIRKLPEINIPGLSNLIGNHSILTYFAILAVIIVHILLNKTHFGIKIHSVGESPETALTSGISPNRIKLIMIVLSGALCGLAGSYLSLVVISEFTENMVAGRGFTAFTAVAFGNTNPIVTGLVSLLLGFADALAIRLEIMNIGIAPSIIKMLPYLLSLFVYTIGVAVRDARIRKSSVS